MIAAIVENNVVVNIIYVLPENLEEFPNAIDAEPFGLQIGDYKQGDVWYRDIDGVPTTLPITQ